MRIPLTWLKEYVKVTDDLSNLTNKLTMAGHMLDKAEKISGDTIIDLELRGNRADCYSILGIAREVSALFSTPIKSPEVDQVTKKSKKIPGIDLKVTSKYLKRVMVVKISDVKIGSSPKWLREKLEKYGVPSLNNIVDLTNFVTIETGQPMHAFDLDKIGGNLSIRLAKDGEKMTTFQDKQLTLTNDDLVWSSEDSVISVAGAIGEKSHSISDITVNILLEAASYDQANIRRTIYKHNLLTDAGIRHEKKLDPNLVELGIRRFLYILSKEKWGNIESDIFEFYPNPLKPKTLELNLKYLDEIAGFPVPIKEALSVFRRLNFDNIQKTKSSIKVIPPTYRTDIDSQEDLVEEVLRIIGYDKIPNNVLSLRVPDDATPSFINQEKEIKLNLFSLGFDEIISIPFVEPKMQNLNSLLTDTAQPVCVINRPSPEIEEMRMTMLPSLLKFSQKMINERGELVQIFEVGKVYFQKGEDYKEKRALGLAYWKKDASSFKDFKSFLESLFILQKIFNVNYDREDIPHLTNSYKMNLDGKTVGVGGEINDIYFAEIYLDEILERSQKTKVKLWPKHPPQIEDMTIKIPEGVEVGAVMKSIRSVSNLVSEIELRDIYKNSYTFRISYQHPEKTLTDREVENVRKEVEVKLKKLSLKSE